MLVNFSWKVGPKNIQPQITINRAANKQLLPLKPQWPRIDWKSYNPEAMTGDPVRGAHLHKKDPYIVSSKSLSIFFA